MNPLRHIWQTYPMLVITFGLGIFFTIMMALAYWLATSGVG